MTEFEIFLLIESIKTRALARVLSKQFRTGESYYEALEQYAAIPPHFLNETARDTEKIPPQKVVVAQI